MKLKTGNQQKKINVNKNLFFEKVDKINKTPARLKEKERRNKLVSEMEDRISLQNPWKLKG